MIRIAVPCHKLLHPARFRGPGKKNAHCLPTDGTLSVGFNTPVAPLREDAQSGVS